MENLRATRVLTTFAAVAIVAGACTPGGATQGPQASARQSAQVSTTPSGATQRRR